MSETLDTSTLEGANRDALVRLIISLADSKRLMGIRYSDWTLGAPSIETGVSTASMTQDEWGHARLLYAMLKQLGIDPSPVEHDRPGEEFASLSALDHERGDWVGTVALIALADEALSTMLRSFAEGSFEVARTRVPKMLAEEEFHASLGAAWYRRLAAAQGEAAGLLRSATEEMLPGLLAWAGANDAAARAMVDAGVIGPAEDRLSAFRDAVRDLVALVGMDIDTVEPATDWDEVRGRASGRPDEEACERARGDRNRALLVE
ncbi:MAG: Phenylacetic acid catabolic protein [Longimicrobiales bacterium]